MSSFSQPLQSDGQTFGRYALTLLTAGALFAMYCGYAVVVNPLVQSPAISQGENQVSTLPPPPPPTQGVQMAEKYLPSQPWAANAKFILRTDEAFVYFEDWEPLDGDKAVRFTPFAMVWMQEGRREEELPYTVISQSAYIRFDKPFDIADSDPGRVVGGALEGRVTIAGPDELQIAGRNFIFSEAAMRVWCKEQVRFRHGPHRGTGVGLDVILVPDEVARAQQKLAVKGFRNIQLRRNVAMDLAFAGNSPLAQRRGGGSKPNQPTDTPTPAQSKTPTHVKVRSAGSFNFNVETNIAVFQEDVRVYHPTGEDQYNSLESDNLTLYFRPAAGKEEHTTTGTNVMSVDSGSQVAATTPATPEAETGQRFQSVNSRLEFERMEASGPQVTLRSEENHLIATMNRLKYNADTGRVLLNADETVRVLQKENEMHAPEIELLQEDGGRVDHVWCRGAGWLTNTDPQTGQVELVAQWKKLLRKYPDPVSQLDIIELHQQVQVRQPERQFGLAADLMRLFLEPEASAQNPTKNGLAESRGDRARDSRRLRLNRLLALNNVAIVSPDLHGTAKELHAWFKPWPEGQADLSTRYFRGRPAVALAVGPQAPGQASPRLDYAAGVSVTHPAQQKKREWGQPQTSRMVAANRRPFSPAAQDISARKTTATGEHSRNRVIQLTTALATDRARLTNESSPNAERDRSTNSAGDDERPDHPIQLKADLIRVQVLQGPGRRKTHVSQAITEGHVVVQQEHEPGEEPLQIKGDKLTIENRAKNDQLLRVFGQPAEVRDRGTYIEGREIFLDRGSNDSAVIGAGLLQIPVKRSLEGAELSEPRLLDIHWVKQMTFDGLHAHFDGEVRAVFADDSPATATTPATRNTSSLRCDEMQVTMTERISFAENRRQRQRRNGERDRAADIRKVVCTDNVQLDSYKYEDTRMTEVRRAEFTQLTLEPGSGRTIGEGRGSTTLWSRGRVNQAGLVNGSIVKANAAADTDSAEWQFTRIDFAGKMLGNTNNKVATFSDRVQALSGPVARPNLTIDPENMPEEAAWIRSDSLRLSQHESPTPNTPNWIQALATGNAKIEGNSGARGGIFHGRAESISFDQSKGLYVLRSQGNRQATIWRQTQPGGELSRADAQQMDFIPSRNVLKFVQARNLDGIR